MGLNWPGYLFAEESHIINMIHALFSLVLDMFYSRADDGSELDEKINQMDFYRNSSFDGYFLLVFHYSIHYETDLFFLWCLF